MALGQDADKGQRA